LVDFGLSEKEKEFLVYAMFTEQDGRLVGQMKLLLYSLGAKNTLNMERLRLLEH